MYDVYILGRVKILIHIQIIYVWIEIKLEFGIPYRYVYLYYYFHYLGTAFDEISDMLLSLNMQSFPDKQEAFPLYIYRVTNWL